MTDTSPKRLLELAEIARNWMPEMHEALLAVAAEKESHPPVAYLRVARITDTPTGVFLPGVEVELRSERLIPLFLAPQPVAEKERFKCSSRCRPGEPCDLTPNGECAVCPTCGSDCNERDELEKAEREIEQLRGLLAEKEAQSLPHEAEKVAGYFPRARIDSIALAQLRSTTREWHSRAVAIGADGVESIIHAAEVAHRRGELRCVDGYVEAWLPSAFKAEKEAQQPELSMSMFASKEDYRKAVEEQQRERMEARFAASAPSPPTADFDLPHESDDASGHAEQPHEMAKPADVPLPEPDKYSIHPYTVYHVHQYGQACAKAARDAAFDECAELVEARAGVLRTGAWTALTAAAEAIQAAKKGTT